MILSSTWILLFSSTAYAVKVADFECCHLDPVVQQTAHPLKILVLLPADLRERVKEESNGEKASAWCGTARGGYGNPFPLHGQRDLRENLASAIEGELDALGHDASILVEGAPAPGDPALSAAQVGALASRQQADLILSATITQWQVDISAYGSRKLEVRIALDAVVPGQRSAAWSSELLIAEHAMEASVMRPVSDLRKRAKDWYGKTAGPYLWAASVEDGLAETVAALVAPGTRANAELVGSGGAAPASGGCSKDTDCKGDRVCVRGACEAP